MSCLGTQPWPAMDGARRGGGNVVASTRGQSCECLGMVRLIYSCARDQEGRNRCSAVLFNG